MKKLFYLLMLVYTFSFGQNKMELKPSGYDPIVTEVPGQNTNDIYKKTKDWVQTYYKNPKEVLKADIENEMIRIEGYAAGGFETGMSKMDYSYTIEIEFKDGKYRFNYLVGQFWAGSQRALYSYKYFFKSDGTLRKTQTRCYDSMNVTVNDTYNSLYNYITGNTQTAKKDW